MHDERLDLCKEIQEGFKKHVEESGKVRTTVDKTEQQVLTIEKAQLTLMEDLKGIHTSIGNLELGQEIIKGMLEKKFDGIKIWILTAAIAGLLVLLGECLYFGGYIKQIDFNTKRLTDIEEMHPRMDK